VIKRLVLSAAVMVGLAVLADRGLAVAAGEAAASSVARSNGLAEEPEVSFRGFPFITQALGGQFQEVDVDARDVTVDGMTFSRIEAELRGIKVGLRDALAGEVDAVPVESGNAVVSIDYRDLNDYLDAKPGSPDVAAPGGVLIVRSTIGVPGRGSVAVEGRGTASVTGDGLAVRVSGVRATSGPALPAAVAATATSRLSFVIPTRRLPFGLTLQSVSVDVGGLRVAAVARGIVVRVR